MTAYVKATMQIVWKSRKGTLHTRNVQLGHVRTAQTDFSHLAYLNVGGKGEVISYEVTKGA